MASFDDVQYCIYADNVQYCIYADKVGGWVGQKKSKIMGRTIWMVH